MAESPVARLSPIARTLRDRGNPPPSPEEEEIEYDTYGWFNFDSDAEVDCMPWGVVTSSLLTGQNERLY